jgi:glutaredoxin-related protein
MAMITKSVEFKSKREREQEVDLAKNYRAIGIPAIAAASQSWLKAKAPKLQRDETFPAMIPAE